MRAADGQSGTGRRRTGGRPRRLFGGHHGSHRRPSADRGRARGGRRAIPRLGQRDRRDRAAHLAGAGAIHRRDDRRKRVAFFDAIAPIVHRDSIDMSVGWFQSRYDKTGPGGTGADYINCPMDRAQYEAFVAALVAGDKTQFHEWEKSTPYFDGCLPIEVMPSARRDAAVRTDEAGRADQSARSADQGLRHRPAPPGQQARHAVQHGRLPRPR